MNSLLLATTAFARLLLGSLLIANLSLWVLRYSGPAQLGTLFALGAMAAAWFSQQRFQVADLWMALHIKQSDPHYAGPTNPEVWPNYESAMRTGATARWLCAALASLSFLALLLGP